MAAEVMNGDGIKPMTETELLVGVISDTHGLLRRVALAALHGSDVIIHAGDVGRAELIDELRAVAPVHAVRGNVDKGHWAMSLPMTAHVEAGGIMIHVLHDISQLDFDPAPAGFAAVVFGHSHKPSIETRGGVLYLNPGAAGPKRFSLPISVARVRVVGQRMHPEIVTLEVKGRAAAPHTPARISMLGNSRLNGTT
jgi:putative phosphoesterase